MKKPELRDTITTTISMEEIKKRIMDFFNQNNMNIKQWDDDNIIGIYGSRLKANFKGIFADPTVLPVKITLNIQKYENKIKIAVIIQDYFLGFYPMGTKKKYIQILAHLMNKFKLMFYSDMSTENISRCPYCNKILHEVDQKFCEMCGFQLNLIAK